MNAVWNSQFYQKSGIFTPILPAYDLLNTQQDSWPELLDFQQLTSTSKTAITNSNQIPIRFVPQIINNKNHEQQYENLIYNEGKVQTRLESWHDFFQVLVWHTFPRIKARINSLHYHAARKRHQDNPKNKQRSSLENFLTLFDECGAIVLYSDEKLASLIKEFQWNELFIGHRSDFSKSIECMVFGHGMYEKAINPYIGMTAQCLLLKQPKDYFDLSIKEKTEIVDKTIVELFEDNFAWTSQSLQPLPLLGIPGWYAENNNPAFYNNTHYFRQKSERRKQ